jgi:hypothetical protein
MKTRLEIREMVKALSPEECYDFINEITCQRKVVVYGNWYNKQEIQDIVNERDSSYFRDLKIDSVLQDEGSFDFDDFYDSLSEHSYECYGGPDEDFRTYILDDFMVEYSGEAE